MPLKSNSYPPNQSKKRYIKNLLINPRYQIKYSFYLSTTAVALVVIYSTLTYHYVSENYSYIIDLAPITDDVKTQLYQELSGLIIKIGGISLIFTLIINVFGILLSHRTAGPLYHFKRVFEAIKKGDHSARVRLRPKDDFKDVAATFNEMMDELTQKK